jgi:hypothetical protein
MAVQKSRSVLMALNPALLTALLASFWSVVSTPILAGPIVSWCVGRGALLAETRHWAMLMHDCADTMAGDCVF